MRRFLLLGSVLLAALLAWRVWPSAERPRETQSAGRTAPMKSEPPMLGGGGALPALPAETTEPAGESEEDDEGAEGLPRVRFEGTLALKDEHGVALPPPTGTMHIRAWGDEDDRCLPVEVVDGHWSLEGPYDSLELLTFAMGERYASLGDLDSIYPEEGETALEATLLPVTRLHVLDAETGTPLAGVRLVLPLGEYLWALDPGPVPREALLVEDGVSPLVVPVVPSCTYPEGCLLHVVAAEHAWANVRVDLLSGGERTVRLPPAGNLRILLRGEVEQEGLWVWGLPVPEDEDELLAFSLAAPDAAARPIDGLAPGRYLVRCGIAGDSFVPDVVVGEARCEVVTGRESEVVLDVGRPPEVALVPASGVLHLDPAWEIADPGLWFALLEPMHEAPPTRLMCGRYGDVPLPPVPGEANTWRFDLGHVPAGRYHVSLDELGYNTEIQVPPEGREDLRIDVAAPATLVVRLADDSDGRAPDVGMLTWSSATSDGVELRATEWAQRDEGDEAFELRVPAGHVHLVFCSRWHWCPWQVVEVAPGARVETTLSVTPTGEIGIVLLDGEARIPVEDAQAWVKAVEAVAGDGRSAGWTGDEGAFRIQVTSPGRYRVTPPDIPGYRPVEPQEVVVEARKTTRLEIHLQRRP